MSKSEKDEFYDDILTTAVEGGINYWATVRNYKWSDDAETTVEVREDPDAAEGRAQWVKVDRASIRRAVGIIIDRSNDLDLREDYRVRIGQAYRENDAGDLDAFDADIIVQVAVLGNVVYG
jgi:hypothetical protein